MELFFANKVEEERKRILNVLLKTNDWYFKDNDFTTWVALRIIVENEDGNSVEEMVEFLKRFRDVQYKGEEHKLYQPIYN